VVGLLQPREGPASIHTPNLLAVWSRARLTYQRGHYRTTRPSHRPGERGHPYLEIPSTSMLRLGLQLQSANTEA